MANAEPICRGSRTRWHLWLFLVLVSLFVAMNLAGPFLRGARERQIEQEHARVYLQSLKLPLYPSATLERRLSEVTQQRGRRQLVITQVAFHTRDDFATVVRWYQSSLQAASWRVTSTRVPRVGENWAAQRSIADTTTKINVSAPAGESFVAIVYIRAEDKDRQRHK